MVNFYFLLGILLIILVKSKKNELLLLISFSIIFGFILFPYQWDTIGEQYYDYARFLDSDNVFSAAKARAYTIQPLFYEFAEKFRNLFETNSIQSINLIRYFIFFFSLLAMYYFSYHLRKDLSLNNIFINNRFPSLVVFLFCIQWSFSYLIVANQFRQFFAFPFIFFWDRISNEKELCKCNIIFFSSLFKSRQ